MYRKAWCTCKPVVFLNKPIAVLTVSLPSPPSLLKLPNGGSEDGGLDTESHWGGVGGFLQMTSNWADSHKKFL